MAAEFAQLFCLEKKEILLKFPFVLIKQDCAISGKSLRKLQRFASLLL